MKAKNQKTKTLKPLKRKIHLSSGIWTYRVAHATVQIRNPELTTTHRVSIMTLTGRDPYNFEKDRYKGNLSITPREVKNYIEKNLL